MCPLFAYVQLPTCNMYFSVKEPCLHYLNYSLASVVKDFPGTVIAEEPEWKECIQGSNGVVNLAGLPISTRWSSEVSIACLLNLLIHVPPPLPSIHKLTVTIMMFYRYFTVL